jgi:restriction system protein
MDLIREVLQCEVVAVGGRRDGGVDGYIVRSDGLKTLVQVKWHRDKDRAESVRLVREVAGTLLARVIPNGLIVTTRSHLSRDAARELELVSEREVTKVGRIQLGVHLYQDLLDMLEIAWVRQGESFEPATPWLRDTPIEETMEQGTPGASWIFDRSPWP